MLGVKEGGSRRRGENVDKDVSQLLMTLLGPRRRWNPSLSFPPPKTNQFSGDPTCYFSSPTLNPVTRDLKEGNPSSFRAPVQSLWSNPSRLPTEPPWRPQPRAHRPHARGFGAPPPRACAPLPSLALGGATAPRPSPWSPLAAEWGLRKGRSVPRGAEAAFAPAPAPCGSNVSE